MLPFEFMNQVVDNAVDRRLRGDQRGIVAVDRHRPVVRVAVADVTEGNDAQAGKRRLQRRIGA